MLGNNCNISFNNPLYRDQLIQSECFTNSYLDIIDRFFLKTPVTERGGGITLYSMKEQRGSKLESFSSDPNQLEGNAMSDFLLKEYSLRESFPYIVNKSDKLISEAEKLVMKKLSKLIYRSYLLEGMNDVHSKTSPVDVKITEDFLEKFKEVEERLNLTFNNVVMSVKTANDLIKNDKGIQKKRELYELPEFDAVNLLRIYLGIEPFIFELPEDNIYDGYIYLLHSSRSLDIYSTRVGLRNFVYNGSVGGGKERAKFDDGKFARRYYDERVGINGGYVAQLSVIGQLKVDNPNLFAVLKLNGAKELPKAYPTTKE
ncbi:hypothetical protein DB313_05315 (plasmid) [Borrelia turcica IST7]|uniref:Uncharacterized protein n=1 Tax=Borrelia turcica IST7 TaxID=1104446 RepID=A0A386PQJ0_9SPIR|nr:hypothetical protein [Borrelia turcica]AYE36920.1 hypothetical protein DB313_05315 [Borrelia turcica IST7]